MAALARKREMLGSSPSIQNCSRSNMPSIEHSMRGCMPNSLAQRMKITKSFIQQILTKTTLTDAVLDARI